jgi:hypothetical protein
VRSYNQLVHDSNFLCAKVRAMLAVFANITCLASSVSECTRLVLQGAMDYSLLVGLHNVGFPLAPVSDSSGAQSSSGSCGSYCDDPSQSFRLLQTQKDSGAAGGERRSPKHSLMERDPSTLWLAARAPVG